MKIQEIYGNLLHFKYPFSKLMRHKYLTCDSYQKTRVRAPAVTST